MTLDTWLSAAHGDPSGFWFMSLLGDLLIPESHVWGELAATGTQDAKAVAAYYAAGGDPGSILGNAGTDHLWGGGGMARAWPATPDRDEFTQVRPSAVETLLVGGTLDFSTPPKNATRELLPHLSNGHQVVLAELGHTNDFWTYEPEAGSRLINTFFDTGAVDDSGYTRRAMDFSTGVTFSALAKGILGFLLGFALLALGSLVWLPYRVRRRGRIGPKASVWLRSVSPLVTGLGGWSLATLAVLTFAREVPFGDPALAIFGAGVPVGLGIYLAWVRRDWWPRTSIAGFGAAVGGSLLGAWLGFHATTGLLALVTTIVGAAVTANLALIVLDIAWDRSGRPRTRDRKPAPLPETEAQRVRA
jgi:TAP-like protein